MAISTLPPVALTQVHLSPGSHLLIEGVSWEQYEAFLEELGEERRVPRINYCDGILELMSPLPAHERPHRIIAHILVALLDAQERAWEDFGSTTFRKPKRAGLEPDTCFYIQHAPQVCSHMRMDMEVDPPPDLAIETDVTSKTTFDAYATLEVPELWIYENRRLRIYLLTPEGYRDSTVSLVFPEVDILTLIPERVERAFEVGTSQMLREFRASLQASSAP
ncbi:Uma2 family endonuclease [Thermostichus vulcanus]|uniref:Uma2 family endonuclease n=1 Tax=Thermostichus vulcanus str. 'Rupite' TaxID=2813851 RepID=A0ABT0C7K1_THEVL|nr:Uma2 family endonuclease [Thermostichus vulcanus]MCJ2541768.1 Uma2 family endonuclease [Thermostichus vulcanus str. 'Rupite']